MFKLFRKNKDDGSDKSDKSDAPLTKRIVDMGGRIMPKAKSEAVAEDFSLPGDGGLKTPATGFSRAMSFVLLALVFLMPLLFLPTSSEAREFNKQALLFLAVVIMLGIWVIRVLTTRSVSYVKTSLDYIILVLLGTSLLSSIFSLDRASSFLGYYGRFTGSFLSVLTLALLYFLIVNHVRNHNIAAKLTKYLTWSFGLVLIYSTLQLLGVFALPLNFAQSRSFNPIGSLVALSIFAALSVLLVLWLWLSDRNISRQKNVTYTLMLILGLLVMFFINAFVAWLVLGLGTIAFLAIGMALESTPLNPPLQGGKEENSPPKIGGETGGVWFWKPMLVLVVAILFVAFQFLPQSINPRRIINLNIPVEVQLSNATTLNLVKNALASGVKPAVIGFGPGTTGLAFGDIKPESLNKTVVWNLNFDRASSEAANLLIENGILGFLAFELTSILFLVYGLYFLLKKTDHPGRQMAFGFFVLWLTLYATHFFYFFNTTFYFLYWLFLAAFMAVAHWQDEATAKSSSLSSSPRATLSWMFASLLMLAVLLVGAFFEIAVYAAESSYVSGVRIINSSQPDYQAATDKFFRATNLNPYRDVYYLALSQGLIFLSSQEVAKPNPNVANIQAWLSDSVNSGVRATRISPAKAANWSALAQFYAYLKPLGVAGASDAIINSWNEAVKRDPKNPVLLIRLAQAYSDASEVIDPKIVGGADSDSDGLPDSAESQLGSNPQVSDSNSNGISDGDEVKSGFQPAGNGRLSSAQLAAFTRIDQTKLAEAQKVLNRAIELKADLPDSYIALGRILEKSGKLTDARKKLDEAVALFPQNADVKFEQGRIAYNQKNYAEAETILNAVIVMVPNHANAHYSLGLVYQQRGETTRALAAFKKAREITGPNVELERLINSLE